MKQTFTVEGHDAFLISPPQANATRTIPWVWYAPTLSQYPSEAEDWMFDQFLDHGIAIAGIDVGESFGSPKGRALYSALYKKLTQQHDFAKQACLLARSRGGLMLYNWAVENPESIAGITGIYPVCNLASYPGFERACEAYDMTESQLKANLTQHNPIDRLAPLAKNNVPIFHIHGNIDDVVPLEENSQELANRYTQLGGNIILNIVKDQGHNMWPGFFQCQELVDFIITHATSTR